VQFTSFGSQSCSGSALNGIIQGSTLNRCSVVGNIMEVRRCDPSSGEIVVTSFNSGSNCQGEPTDTYRLPVGCVDTPGDTSARETCESTAASSNVFSGMGSGVVTLLSSSIADCGTADAASTNTWTFIPLNTCVVQDGQAPYRITGCDSSAGTYTQEDFAQGSASCDDSSSPSTINLQSCDTQRNGRFARQICVNMDGV
jgi:hypothetical protein